MLRLRFEQLLDRMQYATAETVGPQWKEFRDVFLDEVQKIDDRLQALEAHPQLAPTRATLKLPAKQRG